MSEKNYFPAYWAPDINPDWNVSPGVLTAVSDLYPSKKGTLRSWGCTSNAGVSFSTTTYSKPVSARILRDVQGTGHLIVGTTKRLMYALDFGVGVAFQDKSKGGTDYTTTTNWSFCTQGNYIFACSKENAPQIAAVSAGVVGTFADLGGSPPKSALVVSQKDFILMANCNDGVDDLGDRVWWSGIGNNATWTPSGATEAGNIRLWETPGDIRAMLTMRDFVVCYKDDSIFVLEYVGNGIGWAKRCVSHSVGCGSPNGVAVFGDTHWFVHGSGVWCFDGSSLKQVANEVSDYLKNNFSSASALHTCHTAVDEQQGLVVWFLRNTSDTTAALTDGLALNVFTGRLGWIDTPWTSNTATCTIRATSQDYTDWDASVGANSSSKLRIGIVGFSGTTAAFQFASVNGAAAGSFTTGFRGRDEAKGRITRVIPRTLALTSLTSASDKTSNRLHSSQTTTSMNVDSTNYRFDGIVEVSDNWHQLTIAATGLDLLGLVLEEEVDSYE